VRRFFGDSALEGVLVCFTLTFGWFFWFILAATFGQTPAKQLVSVRVYSHASGLVASTERVWFREIFCKELPPLVIGIAVGLTVAPLAGTLVLLATRAAGASLVFTTEDRRALWDFMAGTVVRHHPSGVPAINPTQWRPQTSRRKAQELVFLLRKGYITQAEFERRTAYFETGVLPPVERIVEDRDQPAAPDTLTFTGVKLRELEFLLRKGYINEAEYRRRREFYGAAPETGAGP
jgi:hypothetical protein